MPQGTNDRRRVPPLEGGTDDVNPPFEFRASDLFRESRPDFVSSLYHDNRGFMARLFDKISNRLREFGG